MKAIKIIGFLALFTIAFTACKQETTPEVKTITVEQPKKKTLNPEATFATSEFTIKGMSCAVGCAAKIEKSIASMDGVKSAKVDFENKTATVAYDIAEINQEKLEKRVQKAGDYTVENFSTLE